MMNSSEFVQRNIGLTQFLVNPHAPAAIYLKKDSGWEGDNFRNLGGFVEWARGGMRVPGVVQWEILSACNFRCPFCYIVGHSPTQIFDSKRAIEMISELAEAGTAQVILTGGEPLQHPKFAEIYKTLKRAGILVTIYSNLALLSEDLINLFRDFPPYGVEVSIYGNSEDTYEKATGRRAFQVVLNNIDSLLAMGIDVTCKTPATSLTQESIDWIRSWCAKRNLPYISNANIESGLDGADLSVFSLKGQTFYSIEKIRAGILLKAQSSETNDETNALKTGRDTRIAFGCGVAKVGAYIGYDGFLSPCARTRDRKFSVINQSFSAAWQNLIQDILPEEGQIIRGCDPLCRAKTICKMCPALAIKDKDNYYSVDPSYCKRTVALWDALNAAPQLAGIS